MAMLARKLIAGGLALGALLAVSHPARADVPACLDASEKGQRARSAGKLREARERFLACGAASCPALVRQDCAQWNSELSQTLPTVVFGARDTQGRDMFDVSVSMDGEPLVQKLDGKSVTVDPGKHTFRFETAGMPPVEEVALVKEGERARVISVTFGAGTGSTADPATVRAAQDESSSRGGHTPYPWIVAGLGAAGIAVGAAVALTAPDRPGNCDADSRTCARGAQQSDADLQKDREQAATADSQPLLGYLIAGGGVAVVVGGLLWHILEPTGADKSAASLRVLPWTNGQSSGLGLGGRF